MTTGKVYTDFLHEIEEINVDENLREDTVVNWEFLGDKEKYRGSQPREIRTSLTFRDVLKVVKVKF